MRRDKRDDAPLSWQCTDEDLEILNRINVPKLLRPMMKDGAEGFTKVTRAKEKMGRALRIEEEVKRAEAACIEADRRLDELNGEVTSVEQLRKQLSEERRLRLEAETETQTARRLLEVAKARPAIAIHAEGTGV